MSLSNAVGAVEELPASHGCRAVLHQVVMFYALADILSGAQCTCNDVDVNLLQVLPARFRSFPLTLLFPLVPANIAVTVPQYVTCDSTMFTCYSGNVRRCDVVWGLQGSAAFR